MKTIAARDPKGRIAPSPGRPILERIFDKVEVMADGCWVFRGSKRSGGYGQIGRMRGQAPAAVHRVVYEAVVGPIPSGLVLDHLCRVPACCNPDHLEVVTNRVNILRGTGFAARHAAKTHCPQGHPYDEINTYWDGVRRKCRACGREVAARRRRKRKIQ